MRGFVYGARIEAGSLYLLPLGRRERGVWSEAEYPASHVPALRQENGL
jgi:hypothetical protein